MLRLRSLGTRRRKYSARFSTIDKTEQRLDDLSRRRCVQKLGLISNSFHKFCGIIRFVALSVLYNSVLPVIRQTNFRSCCSFEQVSVYYD